MKIVCKLIRAGGSKVEIDGTTYHFKPASDAEGAPHVAEVTDKAHIARLLSITEAYAPAEGSEVPEGTDEPSDYLITGEDGEDIDLGKMTKAELIAFAKANKLVVDEKLNKEQYLKALFAAVTAE